MYHANGMTKRAQAVLASQRPKRVTEAQVTAAQEQLGGMRMYTPPTHTLVDYQEERRVIRQMLEAAADA